MYVKCPPSTFTVSPVIKDAAGEQRKQTAAEIYKQYNGFRFMVFNYEQEISNILKYST